MEQGFIVDSIPNSASDGLVRGSSIPESYDIFSGSDRDHCSTDLIANNELLSKNSKELRIKKKNNISI